MLTGLLNILYSISNARKLVLWLEILFISPTASHCVNGKDLPTTWSLSHVRLGEWDLQTDVDCDDSYVNEQVCNQPPVDIAIEQKIPHEQYNPQASSQHNDIALLRLAENVRYNSYIRPICLPLKPELRANKLVGKTLNVAGWGE